MSKLLLEKLILIAIELEKEFAVFYFMFHKGLPMIHIVR